jgi:hypothetical protein
VFIKFVVAVGLLMWPSLATCQTVAATPSDSSVRGKVFDSGYGSLVEGATITFRGETLEVSAITDSDGRYSIEHIPAGHYTVTINCPGFATYHSDVTLTPGRTDLNTAINVGIQGNSSVGFLVEGIVTDQGKKPLEGVTVVVASPFDKAFIERTATKSDGQYRIRIPRPGQYVVYASKEGHQALAKSISASGERTESNFTLPVFHF